MKEFRIIHSEILRCEISKVLNELEVEQFVHVPNINGVWGKKQKHFNNQAWPGIDEMTVFIIDDSKLDDVKSKLIDMQKRIKESVIMRVIISDVIDCF